MLPCSENLPESILFDLDDTLTDRRLSLIRYSLNFVEEFRSALRPEGLQGVPSLLAEVDQGGYNMSRSTEIVKRLMWRVAPSPDEIDSHWEENFPRSAVARSGLVETFEFLHASGIGIGIVTNGGPSAQETKIDVLGIRCFLRVLAISGSLGFAKPDRRIFEFALAELQCEANSCWFVGDHPQIDILGAESAGLVPVWLPVGFDWPTDHPTPSKQIVDLPALVSLISPAA